MWAVLVVDTIAIIENIIPYQTEELQSCKYTFKMRPTVLAPMGAFSSDQLLLILPLLQLAAWSPTL